MYTTLTVVTCNIYMYTHWCLLVCLYQISKSLNSTLPVLRKRRIIMQQVEGKWTNYGLWANVNCSKSGQGVVWEEI